MAVDEQPAMDEVPQMIETEPWNSPTDIPARRVNLAILVSTGKAKVAIGVKLTQDQVRCLENKDIERYHKRYETYVGARTTETFVDSFLSLYTRLVVEFVPNKLKTLKLCRMILKMSSQKSCPPLSKILRWNVGGCSWWPTRPWSRRNISIFSPVVPCESKPSHPSRDGYPLEGVDEVPSSANVKQSSANAE